MDVVGVDPVADVETGERATIRFELHIGKDFGHAGGLKNRIERGPELELRLIRPFKFALALKNISRFTVS